ncbi:DNA-binding transcriptional MerR regulator [Lactobacillus colini]|uniref:DNA-binding transcriptional MerR regulator n=1 Tax=Lactobacillus colini TaxID=1819254 RepID=A0ABS4MCQ0_9LACO|nr:transcriptional regulator [Lactobacillus colini]MBP2057460.1 DNA-binding transcriptional MerR regulator [Lactobacillus colini]
MERDHNFEELAAPAKAAQDLDISVATLRKYSLLVEKVTGNKNYYERTKQKARLYSKKNIADLRTLQHLAKDDDLTLQEAAQQIFAISDASDKSSAKTKAVDTIANNAQGSTMVDAKQVIKLLTMLQNTITSQNKAIQDLQKQIARVEEQNRKLIDSSHQLAQPSDTIQEDNAIKMQDAEEAKVGPEKNFDQPQLKTDAEKKKEAMAAQIEADKKKSADEMHEEIMEKARENQEKQAEAIHRTLAQMQVQPRRTKRHWWQRIFK